MPKLTIEDINSRLKAAKIRVRIRQKGDALYLRATLPPRPGSTRQDNSQYDLALGVKASADGLRRAEAEAKRLASKLDLKEFNWADYLKGDNRSNTIAELVKEFKKYYLATHSLTENTWKEGWQRIFNRLPQSEMFTRAHCIALINSVQRNTAMRKVICHRLQALCDFAGIDLDCKQFRGNYGKKAIARRELPTDTQIEQIRESIKNPKWQWIYGILAAYGLRPHEAFFCEFINDRTLRVLEGKTGPREVEPLHPEWVEKWSLTEINRPKCKGPDHVDYGRRVSMKFARLKIPFQAYNLRHAYAVRGGNVYAIPVPIMARLMGHSAKEHLATYQQWISADQVKSIYENAIAQHQQRQNNR